MKVVVGLGSNLGSRYAIIQAAAAQVCQLQATADISAPRLSPIFRSVAVAWKDEPPGADYLNAAVQIEVSLSLTSLLDELHRIETQFGRIRESGRRWQNRTLDLDILWAEQTLKTERLTVPHAHLEDRVFALAPLLAVLGDSYPKERYTRRLDALGGPPKTVPAPVVNKNTDRIEVTQALDTADALAFALSATALSATALSDTALSDTAPSNAHPAPTEKRIVPTVGSLCPQSSLWMLFNTHAVFRPTGRGMWRVTELGRHRAVVERVQCV